VVAATPPLLSPSAGCYGLYCEIGPDSPFSSPKATHAFEHCKLSGLPDLNHTNPRVLRLMKDVFDHTMTTYAPDALRLDAAGHSDTVRPLLFTVRTLPAVMG
jgi:glycosidase